MNITKIISSDTQPNVSSSSLWLDTSEKNANGVVLKISNGPTWTAIGPDNGPGDIGFNLKDPSSGVSITLDYQLINALSKSVKYQYTIERIGSTYYATGDEYSNFSGSDATVVIQSAINSLTSGGVIHIKKGLYDNMGQLTFNNDNITIEGEGQSNTILRLKSNFDVSGTDFSFIRLKNSKNSCIRNIQIDGNKLNQTYQWESTNSVAKISGVTGAWWEVGQAQPYRPDNFILENSLITNCTQYGVYFDYGNKVILQNNHFLNNDENNVTIGVKSTNCIVRDCISEGSNSVSMTVYGNTLNANNIIQNCNILDCSSSIGTAWGLAIEGTTGLGANGCKLLNNTITGSHFNLGIGMGRESVNCIISGNVINGITQTGSVGIMAYYDTGSQIKNNTITGAQNFGIELQGCTSTDVSDNIIRMTTGTAAFKTYDFGAIHTTLCTIHNNYFYNGGSYGLHMDSAATSNKITSNILYGNGADYLFGTGNLVRLNFGIKASDWCESISTPTSTGTISIPMDGMSQYKVTPTGTITFNATGGTAGQRCSFTILTSGTTTYTITFGTNFKPNGTLATGTVSGKYFVVNFLCISPTLWIEVGRTTAL